MINKIKTICVTNSRRVIVLGKFIVSEIKVKFLEYIKNKFRLSYILKLICKFIYNLVLPDSGVSDLVSLDNTEKAEVVKPESEKAEVVKSESEKPEVVKSESEKEYDETRKAILA
jgi:hypothetical protein